MTNKTTVVTMYFNIKDLPDNTDEVRPKAFYMEKGKATLSLNAPMVIFCDDTCYEDIKAIRDAAIPNAESQTTYIIKPITEYDFYKYSYPIIRKNREHVKMYENSRNTSSYFILCMFKILGLLISKQKNPYGTPFYAWVDFGGSHIMRSFNEYALKMLENPNPKVSFCYIHYRNGQELSLNNKFCAGFCGIGATAFTVEADYMNQFYNGTMSIFHEILFNKMGHADEQVLTYFHHKHPELCTIYYGDYYSILTNYHFVREDFNSVKNFFINEAIKKGNSNLALVCISHVLRSIREGHLILSDSDYTHLVSLETQIMKFSNENGNVFNHLYIERTEQLHAEKYIPADAKVLELGARYGTVSCVINKRLSNPYNQVSVEPDHRVWNALENNRDSNGCSFHILKGAVSNKKLALNINLPDGYATQTVVSDNTSLQCVTLNELQTMYNLRFDTLVADCEGFLETFFDENPELYDQLTRILFEKDCPDKCNYDKIKDNLRIHGFRCIIAETMSSHEVWQK